MNFGRESAGEVIDDIVSLTPLHHMEITKYDFELKPDFDRYFRMDAAGILRIFTARDESHTLCGYQFFFLSNHPHYQDVKTAHQDLLFIEPKRRGFGVRFLRWCEGKLKEEGVDVVYSVVTTRLDYSLLLKRMGYEITEAVYSKLLR